MASFAAKADNKHGLIILGNSGVGKSFLANILLKEEAFRHEFSARSVTHRTEFREITVNGIRFAIFNIPGLIEADQTRVDLNKREIEHAFQQRSNSMVLYVFGQQNGRIRDEDVVAFDAINVAYPLDPRSLLVVINGLPSDRPSNYEGEVMLMLKDVIKFPIAPERVCFLNHININDGQAKESLRNQLLRFVVELTPTEHKKIQDIHLRVDEVAFLKQQIKQMTKQFEAMKSQLQGEIRDHQQRYNTFVANYKTEKQHLHRMIERQAEDTRTIQSQNNEQVKELQTMHHEQLNMMKSQVAEMQVRNAALQQEAQRAAAQNYEAMRRTVDAAQEHQRRLEEKISDLESRPPQIVYKEQESSCFIAGTQIRMADGTQKSIENIQIGDLVLGMNSQCHQVIFLDTELLKHRLLYSINGSMPFFTSEHVFLTDDGSFVSVEPQASEDEEPSLRRLVHPLALNTSLQLFQQPSTVVRQYHGVQLDSNTTIYNVVLDSGHVYYANDFAVFDMFPNLSRYPRMFKFLHLVWRQCATEVDDHFDDITTPNSTDRLRLENLARAVHQTICHFLSKN